MQVYQVTYTNCLGEADRTLFRKLEDAQEWAKEMAPATIESVLVFSNVRKILKPKD
jgi:hypothetical protein